MHKPNHITNLSIEDLVSKLKRTINRDAPDEKDMLIQELIDRHAKAVEEAYEMELLLERASLLVLTNANSDSWLIDYENLKQGKVHA